MTNFVVWLLTPVVIMVIIMMALSVLVFDFLYELFINLLKSEDDDWTWRSGNSGCLLYPEVVVMDDLDYLYMWAAKIGKRPTEDDEYKFVETVGKLVNDGHTEPHARIEAFKRLYDKWLGI